MAGWCCGGKVFGTTDRSTPKELFRVQDSGTRCTFTVIWQKRNAVRGRLDSKRRADVIRQSAASGGALVCWPTRDERRKLRSRLAVLTSKTADCVRPTPPRRRRKIAAEGEGGAG